MKEETLNRAKAFTFRTICLRKPSRYFTLKYWGFRLLGSLRLYEGAHLRYLSRTVNPGDRAYDLGAHFGVYTRLLSRRVGDHGRVVAVEPFDACITRLDGIAKARGNVDVVPAAIGSRAGSAMLHVPLLNGLIPEPAIAQIADQTEDTWAGSHMVSVVTIQTLVDQFGPPDILKADIEGQDHVVLEALLDMPEETRPRLVLLEVWDMARVAPLLEALEEEAGYRVCVLQGGQLVAPPAENHRDDQNIYLIRPVTR